MRKKIRYGMFETNSSMAQVLYIFTKAQYNDFLKKDGESEWVWDSEEEKMVHRSEAMEKVKKDYLDYCKERDIPVNLEDDLEDWFYDSGYRDSIYNDWMEFETTNYTTPGGEELVIVHGAGGDG